MPKNTTETSTDYTVVVVILLLFFWPAGVILMWMWMAQWPAWVKIFITTFCILLTIVPFILLLSLIVWLFLHIPFSERQSPYDKPITISKTNQETTYWTTYTDPLYQFSFKYPQNVLSNFSINGQTPSVYPSTVVKKTQVTPPLPTEEPYGVVLDIRAWEYPGSITSFLQSGSVTGYNYATEKAVKVAGVNSIVVETKIGTTYRYTYFLKKNNFIYKFELTSPKQITLDGNKPLLDKIVSTVTFLETTKVFCTMEAKLCPDGSYVGRIGPKCEFAPCP